VLAVAGGGVLRARDTQAGHTRLTWLGLGGVALAMAGALAPAVLETVVVDVPGGGLLRDGSRFLLLWALPLAMAFGAGVQAVLRQWPRRAVTAFTGVLAVMWPVVTMPDLAWGLGGTVQPAAYPQAWRDVTDAVDSRAAAGDVLVLPFRAYRAPSWNDGHPVLDPAGRLFEVTTVVDDALVVAGTTVRGEDPRAAAVRTALSGTDPAAGLADLGIATVVFASEAGDAGIDLEEFPVVQTSSTVEVRAVPGQIADPAEPARSRLVAVALAWAAAGCLLVAGVVLAVLGRRRSNAAVCPTAR
jgi:hypothetical protein